MEIVLGNIKIHLNLQNYIKVLLPNDTGTFISYASNGITLSDEGTCKITGMRNIPNTYWYTGCILM